MEIVPGTIPSNVSYEDECPWTEDGTGVSILIMNVHSLRNKMNEFESEVKYYKYPTVIVLSETWLTEGLKSFYNLHEYTAYHTTRPDGYGGLSVYVRNDVSHNAQRDVFTIDKVHVTKIYLLDQKINVLGVYRSPSSNSQAFLSALDNLLESNSNVMMCGDLNYDLLSQREDVRSYRNVIETNSFTFLNKIEPESFTFPYSKSILDHFATDMVDEEYHMENNPSISDHHACLLRIQGPPPTLADRPKIMMHHNPRIISALQRYLQQLRNETLVEIHLRMTEIVSQNTLEKISNKKVKYPWIDEIVLSEISKKIFFYDQLREQNLTSFEMARREKLYKAQKNKVTALIRNKRKSFINEHIQASMSNSSKMWQVMKLIIRKNQCNPNNDIPKCIKSDDGTEIDDPKGVLDELNRHFATVGKKINELTAATCSNRPRIYRQITRNRQAIILHDTCQSELHKIIMSLKSDSAAGYDKLSAKNLKRIAQELSIALIEPINQCLREGTFPETFKETRIKALFKGIGNKKDANNYRPISVLSNIAKIMEKLLYNRFFDFLAKHGIISPKQYGFLPNSSTTTAALHAITRIKQSLDDKKLTAAIFIDVAKAFDSVDHAQLLKKLEDVGIRGKAHQIMQNYLFARRQRVASNEIVSDELSARFGFPQGSSLSSLLFLVYVNDCLSLLLNGHIQMYADDTILIYSCDDSIQLQQQMQADLTEMNKWMYDNCLSFNARKTKYMIFKTPRQQQTNLAPIIVNNAIIEKTDNIKYLGLIIDSELNWSPHIAFLKNKLFPYLFVLRNAKYTLPTPTKKSLYFSYIHSHLSYLISVWGYAFTTSVNQLQIVQNKAIRALFWQEYRTGTIDTEGIMKKYKIPNVQQLKTMDSLTMIFKIRHNLIRNEITLQTFEDVHDYHTRNRLNFILPRTRLNLLHNSLFSSGLSLFNSLPNAIKQTHDFTQFKRKLRKHILQ